MTFHAMTEHYEEITDCSRALFSSCASPPTKQKIPRQMSEDFYVVEHCPQHSNLKPLHE